MAYGGLLMTSTRSLFKTALMVTGVALAALVGLAAYLALSFDADAAKRWLVGAVNERSSQRLEIPGQVELKLWPRPGLRLGAASLTPQSGGPPLLQLQSADASLALVPLLSGRIEVQRVQIAGLRLKLQRDADGRSNWVALAGRPQANAAAPASTAGGGASPPSPPATTALPPLVLDGLSITDAEIEFDDRAQARRIKLSALTVEMGRMVAGLPAKLSLGARLQSDAPRADLKLALAAQLLWDPAQGRLSLSEMSADLGGPLAGLAGVQLGLKGQLVVETPVTTNATAQAAKQATTQEPKIALTLDHLGVEVDSGRPGVTRKVLIGLGSAKLADGSLDARLKARLDGAALQARWGATGLSDKGSAAVWNFDIRFDRLDVDAYAGLLAAGPSPAPQAGGKPPAKGAGAGSWPALHANGSLSVQALRVAGMSLSNLKAEIKADPHGLHIEPLTADLYQGRLSGSATLRAGAPLQLALRQRLLDVQIGPLLSDALGQDRLQGRGQLDLDLKTAGADLAAWKQALQGQARIELRDGALRGINVAQVMRQVGSALGRDQTGSATANESTDFSELSASFTVRQGVARNDDLLAMSPLLRVGGAGDIDLVAGQLDYLLKATVVDSLQGQGGPELQALRGQTVPLRLQGPFDAIRYRIDLADMARSAARSRLEGKEEELKDKARRKLSEGLKGLFGK